MIGFSLLGTTVAGQQPAEHARFEYRPVYMGLPVRVVIYAKDAAAADRAAGAAFARIAALDAILSDYRPDSELNRLPGTAGSWTLVSQDLYTVLGWAIEVANASDGAFDPTVGPLTALWREARRTRRMPEATELAAARARVGWRQVTLDDKAPRVRLARSDMRLDLGGIAKGYILQRAFDVLLGQGVPRAFLEAGGDIVAGDPPPGRSGWQVDVPGADRAFAERAASFRRAALATSGGSAQFVEIGGTRYSHVIDPRTGLGVTHDREVSVIASDGATADALATAINVLGREQAGPLLAAFPDAIASVRSAGRRIQLLNLDAAEVHGMAFGLQ